MQLLHCSPDNSPYKVLPEGLGARGTRSAELLACDAALQHRRGWVTVTSAVWGWQPKLAANPRSRDTRNSGTAPVQQRSRSLQRSISPICSAQPLLPLWSGSADSASPQRGPCACCRGAEAAPTRLSRWIREATTRSASRQAQAAPQQTPCRSGISCFPRAAMHALRGQTATLAGSLTACRRQR